MGKGSRGAVAWGRERQRKFKASNRGKMLLSRAKKRMESRELILQSHKALETLYEGYSQWKGLTNKKGIGEVKEGIRADIQKLLGNLRNVNQRFRGRTVLMMACETRSLQLIRDAAEVKGVKMNILGGNDKEAPYHREEEVSKVRGRSALDIAMGEDYGKAVRSKASIIEFLTKEGARTSERIKEEGPGEERRNEPTSELDSVVAEEPEKISAAPINGSALEQATSLLKMWEITGRNTPMLGRKIREAIGKVENVDEPNEAGETLLGIACMKHAVGYVQLLVVEREADVNKLSMLETGGGERSDYSPRSAIGIYQTTTKKDLKKYWEIDALLRERGGKETFNLRHLVKEAKGEVGAQKKKFSLSDSEILERLSEKLWEMDGKGFSEERFTRVEELLRGMENIDSVDGNGRTALMLACMAFNEHAIILIVKELNADLNILKLADGTLAPETALNYVERNSMRHPNEEIRSAADDMVWTLEGRGAKKGTAIQYALG